MEDYIENRVLEVANFILATHSTIRKAAEHFKVSKSTIHLDVTERLPRVNMQLYLQLEDILIYNKSVRHIRGGNATKLKKEMLKCKLK